MKLLVLILAGIVLLYGCSTPPTAEQINAYANVAHNAVQDYKAIRQIEKTP